MPEITYTGHTAVPSDYECGDGQLALSLNLINENGSMLPLFPPTVICTLPENCTVAYIHKTKDYTHYIIENTALNYVWWLDAGTIEQGAVITEGDLNEGNTLIVGGEDAPAISSIQAIGNTLLIMTEDATHYFLWNDEKDNYTNLGTQLPNIDLRFALNSVATLKMYPDTGVTKTKSEYDDDDDSEGSAAFTVIKGATYAITSSGGSTSFAFDDVTLYRDRTYRLRQLLKVSATEADKVTIYGVAEGETAETEIKTFDSKKYMVLPERDSEYTDIRVVVAAKDGRTLSGTLYLEYESGAKVDSDLYYVPYTQDNYQCVLGYINKFVMEEGTKENKFIHPFFVRYALKLFDNSTAYMSDPMLMIPNSGYVPFVHCDNAEQGDKLNLYAFLADLQYKLMEGVSDDWQDIIQGVNIYVSQPIYPYDQSEEYEKGENKFVYKDRGSDIVDEIRGISFGYASLTDASDNIIEKDPVVADLFTIIYQQYGFGGITTQEKQASLWRLIQVAPKDSETIKEDIANIANFYLVKKINFSDLKASEEFQMVEMEENTLNSLVNREPLSEDNISYSTFVGANTFVYNSRLHIYGGKAVYKDISQPTRLNQYLANATTDYVSDDIAPLVGEYNIQTTWVYIHTSNGEKVVRTDYADRSCVTGGYMWLYYPNNRAYKMVIKFSGEVRQFCIEVPLSEHEFLNGAYFLYYFPYVLFADEGYRCDEPDVETDNTTDLTNSIYVSEVNNPFAFYNTRVVSVGSGEIRGLSSAAKALSQGQFGQFPLYAFCDDGVWALSVSTEGVYSAVQPITRDVCINAAAITQLDSSVLFPTDRGIMQISGSTCACFTDILNGRNVLDITTLPHYDTLLSLAHHEGIDLKPIYDLLKTCIIVYDYTNQHIYVCDDASNMAYVISLKSNAWGMAAVDIRSTVNAYPEAYAMDSNNNFVDFSHPNTEGQRDCLLITRPLKLENPNTLKTATAVVQRGFFRRGHVQSALYGSRDLLDWYLIKSSQGHEMRTFAGTPYKYFRLAVVAQLENEESIFGATLNAIERFTNKAR